VADYEKAGPSAARDQLRSSIRDLINKADQEAKTARTSAARWRLTHLLLGLPTAVLAAIAGFTGLISTTGRVPAAILALVAAALSAASTFLGSEARAATKEKLSSAWTTLSSDAQLIAAFEGNRARSVVLRNQLSLLYERQDAIMASELETARKLREKGAGRSIQLDEYDPTGDQ
jgi:hypothetical protein